MFCRLWGDHGQEALESAHVCLINATATGTEILKNLVLPGKVTPVIAFSVTSLVSDTKVDLLRLTGWLSGWLLAVRPDKLNLVCAACIGWSLTSSCVHGTCALTFKQ